MFFLFFFNDTATTEIYTLSLHDALPICASARGSRPTRWRRSRWPPRRADRKSTRLNSSHGSISYAVFCLKKKKKVIQAIARNIITIESKNERGVTKYATRLDTSPLHS